MKKLFFSIILSGIGFLLLLLLIFSQRLFNHKTAQPQPATKAPQTKMTIIEGWDNKDIEDDLDSNPKRADAPHLASPEEFKAAQKAFSVADYPILASKPNSANLEGFLFPDTYFLPLPSTTTNESEILIEKALNNFSTKFTAQMEADAKKRGMTVYQTVILASIIEKETGKNITTEAGQKALDEERKMVAGLFYNRLNIGMPLQSDATVNYITNKKTPSVSIADTKIDSPYNTYMYKGLTPGPICNPSLSSLMAAIYPTDNDYLYFLTDSTTGKAVFAKTFDEHIANQRKYLK